MQGQPFKLKRLQRAAEAVRGVGCSHAALEVLQGGAGQGDGGQVDACQREEAVGL